MKKGFLIIDGNKNTLLIESDYFKDILELITYQKNYLSKNMDKITHNETMKALDQDIRNYLKGVGKYE